MLQTFKQIGILSIVLSNLCFASVYVGGALGPEGATFSQRAHVVGQNPNATSGVFDVRATNHFSGTGVFGSIFGGYDWRFTPYYIGLEINGNLSSVEYDLTNDEYIHHNFGKTYFTIKNNEGISLLPGIFLAENTLVYGRIAYANGHLKIFEGADPSIQSLTQNLNGIRYGVGIRQAMSPQWALMMDYSQINYEHVKSHTFDPFGVVTKDTKITPSTAQIAFGVIYHFDQPHAS